MYQFFIFLEVPNIFLLIVQRKSFFMFFYVLLTVHPHTVSQINPTRCTILFNVFIYFSSLHVSGVHAPIITRKLLYLCDTGTCHSVWVASGLLVGLMRPSSRENYCIYVTLALVTLYGWRLVGWLD